VIRALASFLTGGLADRLLDAYRARLAAQNDALRVEAETRIAALEAEVKARAIAKDVRLAMVAFWEMRLLTFLAGFFAIGHFGAVAIDSTFPGLFPSWVVQALPRDMADWQGTIILGLFGYGTAGIAARAWAVSAIARR